MTARDIAIILLVSLFLVGCGAQNGQEEQPKKEEPHQSEETKPEQTFRGTLPKIGIVSQIDAQAESFTLVLPPQKEGDQITFLKVLAKGSEIKTKSGESRGFLELKNNETVKIDGYVDSQNDAVAKLIEIINEVKQSFSPNPKTFVQNLPMTLKEHLGDKLPKDFQIDNWTISKGDKTKPKSSVQTTTLSKGAWMVLVSIDPQTKPLYEIALAGPDKFKWAGVMMEDGTLKP